MALSNNLDSTVIFLFIEGSELSLFLPIIEGSNEYHNNHGDDNRDPFNKVDLRSSAVLCRVV